MKNIILTITILISLINTLGLAQESKSFRIGVDYTNSISKDVDLYRLSIEPKYQIQNNVTIGLKLMASIYSREPIKSTIEFNLNGQLGVPSPEREGYLHGALTSDYYILPQGKLSPYIGFGFGLFPIRNVVLIEEKTTLESTYIASANYNNKHILGFILRGGLEFKKLRLGIEYNIIDDSTIKIESTTNENINNSSFNINIGYIIGGGKHNTQESD